MKKDNKSFNFIDYEVNESYLAESVKINKHNIDILWSLFEIVGDATINAIKFGNEELDIFVNETLIEYDNIDSGVVLYDKSYIDTQFSLVNTAITNNDSDITSLFEKVDLKADISDVINLQNRVEDLEFNDDKQDIAIQNINILDNIQNTRLNSLDYNVADNTNNINLNTSRIGTLTNFINSIGTELIVRTTPINNPPVDTEVPLNIETIVENSYTGINVVEGSNSITWNGVADLENQGLIIDISVNSGNPDTGISIIVKDSGGNIVFREDEVINDSGRIYFIGKETLISGEIYNIFVITDTPNVNIDRGLIELKGAEPTGTSTSASSAVLDDVNTNPSFGLNPRLINYLNRIISLESLINPYELNEIKIFEEDKGVSFVDKYGNTWTRQDGLDGKAIVFGNSTNVGTLTSGQIQSHTHQFVASRTYNGSTTDEIVGEYLGGQGGSAVLNAGDGLNSKRTSTKGVQSSGGPENLAAGKYFIIYKLSTLTQ